MKRIVKGQRSKSSWNTLTHKKKLNPPFVLIYLKENRRVLNLTQTFVNKCIRARWKFFFLSDQKKKLERTWLWRAHGLMHTFVPFEVKILNILQKAMHIISHFAAKSSSLMISWCRGPLCSKYTRKTRIRKLYLPRLIRYGFGWIRQ